MNAHNVNKLFHPSFSPGHLLTAVRLQFAARLDLLVARWLARCAANIEAAQELFKADQEPLHELRRA
jgi:hypothetical protein